MRLLVTGGAGFVGSNLVHYWLREHPQDEVIVLDKLTYAGNLESLRDLEGNPKLTFIRGDICDYALMREVVRDCDNVLHLAAESHVDRSLSSKEAAAEFFQTNVDGTRTVLQAVSSWGANRRVEKVIHMSTDEVWGTLDSLEGKFHKGLPLRPTQPYSISKAEGQVLAHHWNEAGDLVAVVNCTNIVGGYQFPEKMIPLSVTNVLEGKPVRVYGEGKNWREYIYTEDICRGFDAVISKGRVGIGDDPPYEYKGELVRGIQYLFGSGQEITNLGIAQKILEMMGKPIIIAKESEDPNNEATIHLVGDCPIHDFRYTIDYSDTTKELGWKPESDLTQSLERTIDWYRKSLAWWKPLKEGKRTVYAWGSTASKER